LGSKRDPRKGVRCHLALKGTTRSPGNLQEEGGSQRGTEEEPGKSQDTFGVRAAEETSSTSELAALGVSREEHIPERLDSEREERKTP